MRVSSRNRVNSRGALKTDLSRFPTRNFSAKPYASRLSLFGPRLSGIPATTISST
jgi:hypothetical protein